MPLLVDASYDIPFIVRSAAEGYAGAQRVVVSKCRFIDFLELRIGRRVGQKGYLLHPSSRARSAPTYSAPLARWDWKAWSRSGEIAPIVAADAHWIKVKNPASLAMNRAAEIDWSR